MGRIIPTAYERAYKEIKQDASEGNCIIFIASDVDSICACKIFQALLKGDMIQHKIVPVSGYKDLENANEKLIKRDSDLRSIVMINCGGAIELNEFFRDIPNVKIYVFDSHRPLNLDNLTDTSGRLFVFDEYDEDEKMKKMMGAHALAKEMEDSSDAMSSDQDLSDEEDSDRPTSHRPRQRRRLNNDKGQTWAKRRAEKRRQTQLLKDYYGSGVYYANSVAGMMYALATLLSKTNNELLWLAITGVTAQYIFERINTEKYMEKVQIFTEDVSRFNISSGEEDSSQSASENRISPEDEYRFMLFRHWSLYDSMFHSGYVASKLGVWREFGQKRLSNMFARMGFSLKQCREVYNHMDMELKMRLREKIETVAPIYGLTDICFPSFSRAYGWKYHLSASDVVYSLATLLETSPSAAQRLNKAEDDPPPEENWRELDDLAPEDVDGLGSVRRKWWLGNFYTAFDSLSNADAIRRGLNLCMKTQKAIVRQGMAVIDKRNSTVLSNFRMITINKGADLPIFQHPLTVSKLALFLTDAYREHGKRNLPLVIASLDEENDSYLVVSSTGAKTFGETRKNPFAIAFHDTAKNTRARTSFDSFEASILQIHKGDLEIFVENLYAGLP
ncbi:CDC45 family [Spinellus fusiger]|nr:CDC45 family [Spinellus fusiger]